ncbi:unnamed protein product [Arctia plantaginis]|uniref:UNC93-like protein n=1 Tax=Arctia plantaginis TaxID=874455 RepID=A0A8S1BPG7_ARCPL|nr:unnamed protein product [Arctia plantaginis]
MFFLTSYGGAANLQSSINAEAGLGTASLAAVYAGGIFSTIFLSSLIINWLGAKWAMCCGIMMYVPYILSQVYSKFYTLVPAGLFLGVGSAPIWCAVCTYLSVAAHAHSLISKIPAKVLLQTFFGYFYMVYQTGQIWGNLFSSLVLSVDNKAAVTSVNETMIPELCGANFLVGTDTHDNLPPQSPEKIQMLSGVYLGCMFLSFAIIAIGLDSMKRYESCREDTGNRLTGIALLAATSKQLTNPDQLLFIALSIFIGLEEAFLIADFTASFVSCVIGTGSVGYVMMTFGISDAAGCFVNGYLAKVFGRMSLVVSAFILHMGLLLTMLLWRPHAGDDYLLFLLALLWGVSDSIWIVQINAYFGSVFHGKEEAAFSSLQLFVSLGYIIIFVFSSYVRTRYKIYLLMCSLILGMLGYFTLEYKHRNDRKITKEFENLNKDNNQESVLLNA